MEQLHGELLWVIIVEGQNAYLLYFSMQLSICNYVTSILCMLYLLEIQWILPHIFVAFFVALGISYKPWNIRQALFH